MTLKQPTQNGLLPWQLVELKKESDRQRLEADNKKRAMIVLKNMLASVPSSVSTVTTKQDNYDE